jgi:hypothetical protein
VKVTDAQRFALSHAITLSVREVSRPPMRAVVTEALENAQLEPAVTVPAEVPALDPA